MDLDFDGTLTRKLRDYVRLTAEALGVVGDSWFVSPERPCDAYLALDGRLGGHDVALLWSETRGWSLAAETGDGDRVVARLDGDPVPEVGVVAAWVRRQLRAERPLAV
ncbi:hypothetical protein SAMN05421504_1011194 [Amycolatopsis xylanica]|uniref:DUF6292 domain-containing protein n=1 Tax=Amycolatopsis xylanica TaxID=589385 RepID=A0A1H2VE70_9PSEU|nr:DUF6292 family protein [Amycolatopsis xylanica]SDW66510.1 hypothetical protein SAMN05421504_1011194 [Amycolatopsis xylanica]